MSCDGFISQFWIIWINEIFIKEVYLFFLNIDSALIFGYDLH